MNFVAAIRNLLQPAKRGLRANLVPGLVLQAFILVIILSYYYTDKVRVLLDQVGEIKRTWGYLYSALATAVFGGLIPFVVLLSMGRIPKGQVGKELLFYLLFWCWKGVEVDALYRAQGAIFGEGNAPQIIAMKVLADQLLYNPLWASPSQTIFFLWKDSGFSFKEMKSRLQSRSITVRVLEVILSTWLVWLPAVSFIYMLPGALQVPLFNLVLCFWCLLLTFVTRENG